MTGRPRATTHWAIRDVALELFIGEGYAEISLASIARACGISRTTLFAYFPAKADILLYGDERNIDRVVALFEDAPFDVAVGSVVVKAARTMRPLPSNVREELDLYWGILDQNNDVGAKAEQIAARYSKLVTDFVAERLDTNPTDPMPMVFGSAVVAALRARARHWTMQDPSGVSLEDAMENTAVLMVAAYLGDR